MMGAGNHHLLYPRLRLDSGTILLLISERWRYYLLLLYTLGYTGYYRRVHGTRTVLESLQSQLFQWLSTLSTTNYVLVSLTTPYADPIPVWSSPPKHRYSRHGSVLFVYLPVLICWYLHACRLTVESMEDYSGLLHSINGLNSEQNRQSCGSTAAISIIRLEYECSV